MSIRSPRFDKDLRPDVSRALAAGWRWEEGRVGRHRMLISPSGARLPVPQSAAGGLAPRWRKRLTALMDSERR